MSSRYPYLVIAVVSVITGLLRIPVLPSWSWSHHLFALLFQFSVISFMWWTIRELNTVLDRKIPYHTGFARRLFLQILLSLLLTSPMLFLVNWVTEMVMPPMPFMNRPFMVIVFILFSVTVALINFSFYGSYFFKSWKFSVSQAAELAIQRAEAEREKSIIQYHHLKNQVNPHFLFNTLSSLDGLVLTDPPLASVFIRHLSKVYRYVLEQNENELVSLSRELEFIQHYLSILNIKYKAGLEIIVEVSNTAGEKNIAMVTLQMLIDNAIKHNIISAKNPLTIHVSDSDDHLVVRNNKQLRTQIEHSTRQGLAHLKQLYQHLTHRPVQIIETERTFEVKIPLL